MVMPFFRVLAAKNPLSSASAVRRKKEHDCYLKNGSAVLEEFLALCDGNCRIPIRYFSAVEINNAIKHSKTIILDRADVYVVTGLLDNRPVFVRFNAWECNNIHRDIAITAQMSHLKNVLRLVGCCLELEQSVMVYEYVEAISLCDLLYKKSNPDDQTRKSLCWGNRLRVARDVASAVLFLHTEFTTPIIHRNIKPSNVIIDEKSGVAKIVDFSLSISLPPGELELQDEWVRGTIGYIAPEYQQQGIITQKTDVYSFGVLLFQLLTGKDVYGISNRVDSTNLGKRINFEEAAESNIAEGSSVDSTYSTETIDFINIATDPYIEEDSVIDITDPIILEEHGIEIQQQLEDYLDLVKKCTADKADDRPYMIHVARELCRMEKSFRSWSK
ncbi:non-functional pseudokinase ZED1-like [Solanum pennellii]|uniref:Non-functional pseudokinase ZED1-like n=1 Tax=Solanum pennellii TaxID=28526 RepID=A0ABM1GXH5_SOLPN|nr:non-functional pseudokinase ZED1-like [Solanum pennellii]